MSPLKLSRETDGATLRVVVRGAIEGGSCDCLRHFWDAHCSSEPPPGAIVLDLSRVEHVDARGADEVRALVAASRERGARVTLAPGAPAALQDLAPPPSSS
jgi:anti-anti-sigma regulatory factor